MARHRLTTTATDRPQLLRVVDAFVRWRFRHTGSFTCADCLVTYDVPKGATATELRRVRTLATDHSRHGVYADRNGTPYGQAVYGN
jgi:hypothetical protein